MPNNYDELIVSCFESNIAVKRAALKYLLPVIHMAAQSMVAALRCGNKLLLMGNGGSAADAQHLAAEFVGRFPRERRPLPALALHEYSSTLTAVGNDYGYENSFLRPLQAFAVPGDIVIGISTYGNSANVVAVMAWARQLPLTTFGLTGEGGGAMRKICDIMLDAP